MVKHNPVGLKNKNVAMENKSKGGRPRLDLTVRRRYRVVVKMNTKEYYTLRSKAKEAGMRMQEYLRRCVFSSTIVGRISLFENDFVRQLSGMATNLNQLAKDANTYGYVKDADSYSHMSENIITIINKIRDDWKSNGKK